MARSQIVPLMLHLYAHCAPQTSNVRNHHTPQPKITPAVSDSSSAQVLGPKTLDSSSLLSLPLLLALAFWKASYWTHSTCPTPPAQLTTSSHLDYFISPHGTLCFHLWIHKFFLQFVNTAGRVIPTKQKPDRDAHVLLLCTLEKASPLLWDRARGLCWDPRPPWSALCCFSGASSPTTIPHLTAWPPCPTPNHMSFPEPPEGPSRTVPLSCSLRL